MAAITKLFCTSLALLCMLQSAFGYCTLSNITVSQSTTSRSVGGKPEYEVVVSNDCICSQSSLLIGCKGFDSVEPVDPSIFQQLEDGKCSVNNAQPVFQDYPIKFNYSWDAQVGLQPFSSQINCS